jgi:hypothetical protein
MREDVIRNFRMQAVKDTGLRQLAEQRLAAQLFPVLGVDRGQ